MRLARVGAGVACACLAGCSLFLDTGGLSGEGTDAGAPDASIDALDEVRANDAGGDAGESSDSGADADAGPIDPSLVGEWKFEEGTGTTANDTSGHGRTGIIIGGTWTNGKYGGAIELSNASSGAVVIAATSDFDRPANAAFTITAWLRPSGGLSHDFALSVSYGNNGTCFGLEAQSTTLINYYCGEFDDGGTASAHIAESTVTFTTAVWSHLATVVSGNSAKMYFNGASVGAGTPDTTPRAAIQVLLGSNNYGQHINGALDNVRFYKRALTDAEIVADRDRP